MSGPISSCPPRKRTAERKPLSCFPGSCSGWCLSDTAKHERKMWNSAAIGLIAVWRLWVCESASTSQKFSFNLTQVIGPMKLNWVKKENQKRSVNHFFSQPLNNGSHNPDFCTRNHSDEEDIDDIFCFKYGRRDLFPKERVRVRCPQQKHTHRSLMCFPTWPAHRVNSGFLESVSTYDDGMLGAVILLEGTDSH